MAAVAPINDASLQRGAPVTPKAKVSSGPVTWLDRLAVSPVPYYLCFSTPIFQWIGIHWLGTQWGAILLMFGIVPILDAFVPVDIADPSPQNPTWQGPIGQILYKIPLWTWPFITTWELLWACSMIANPDAGLTWMDTLGIWFTCSAYTGGMGFTIAHELLHKPELFEKGLAYWLLSLTSYMHYFDEHQLGHHKWVATPQDPSTAKLGQNIFAYYAQTIPGTWLSAWEINAAEMKLQGKQVWSLQPREFNEKITVAVKKFITSLGMPADNSFGYAIDEFRTRIAAQQGSLVSEEVPIPNTTLSTVRLLTEGLPAEQVKASAVNGPLRAFEYLRSVIEDVMRIQADQTVRLQQGLATLTAARGTADTKDKKLVAALNQRIRLLQNALEDYSRTLTVIREMMRLAHEKVSSRIQTRRSSRAVLNM